ncbi:hypothetical protein EDB84DRAFT_655181 [Lactarius hengduanensis]|nr:hypothetical protein EDB84DRAFT_655181 [Lactarius hengduanensis]
MSPSPEFLSPKLAKAPFDDPGADLILRSSDGVNFRVFKVILSLASSIFADMFTLPSPPASRGSSDEPPVVALPEDAETLDLALRHCYPIRSPVVAELRDARILLEFARKYQVDLLEPSLTRFLTDTIERDPVGVYALAAAYECWDIAGKALRLSLTLPVHLLQSPELRYSTMEQHQALFHYHILCGKAASAVTMRRKWIPAEGKLTSTSLRKNDFGCSICVMPDIVQDKHSHSPFNNVTRYGPRFLWSYLHRSALILAHHPNPDAVTAEAFVLKDLDCPHCATNKRREMLECSHAFAAEIKSAIEEVPLPTDVRLGIVISEL